MTVVLREYWPGVVSGEKESLERISTSLSLLGIQSIKVPVGLNEDEEISKIQPDFVLDLHFDAPRVQKVFSVGALWNPLDYYDLWGGAAPWTNQMQHDLLVAANPLVATNWLKLYQPNYKFGVLPLNHSVPSTAVRSTNDNNLSKVFYAGIGWDRGAVNGQRHESIFRELDQLGILKIYGPGKLSDGTRPWKGFSSYVGQLPFDGDSLIGRINNLGYGLCLSSTSHMASQIASNRIFETIAGGAIPIVESGINFPFSLDGAISIPSEESPKRIAKLIEASIDEIKSTNGEFEARVSKLQERLLEGFTLDSQLKKIADRVKELKRIAIPTEKAQVWNAIQIATQREPSWSGGLDALETNSTKLALNLYNSKSLLEKFPDSWVLFSRNQESFASLQSQIQSQPYLAYDVIHLTGTYVVGPKKIFIPSEGTSSQTRTTDSFCVRANILLNWLESSYGCASIGALLVGIAEDSKKGDASLLTHGWSKEIVYNLGATNPLHAAGLSSKLDEITLISLARQGQSISSQLAYFALQAQSQTPTQGFGSGILEALASELSKLKFRVLIKHGIRLTKRILSR